MANSNILLFDQLMQNMLSDQEYSTSQQRQNGVQAGIASSQLHNKFSYQVSLVAYAIAQMMLANGMNALDSDQVSTFVANLSSSVVQKVLDKATQQQAVAGTDDTKWMSPLKVAQATAAITQQITQHIANRSNPHVVTAAQVGALPTTGGTMTGPITLPGNPSGALQAVPKQYVDARGWNLLVSQSSAFSIIAGGTTDEYYTTQPITLSGLSAYNELKLQIDFQNIYITSGSKFNISLYANDNQYYTLTSSSKVVSQIGYNSYICVPFSLNDSFIMFLSKSVFCNRFSGAAGGPGTNYTQGIYVPQVPPVLSGNTSPYGSRPQGITEGSSIYVIASKTNDISGTVKITVYGR